MTFTEATKITPSDAVWVKTDGIVRLAIIKDIDWLGEQFTVNFIDGSIERIHWSLIS